MSIFVKLKLKFSREIILIMFDKILKIESHLHSLKDDLDLRPQRKKQPLQRKTNEKPTISMKIQRSNYHSDEKSTKNPPLQ